MRMGYIIASKRVTEEHLPIGYLYREPPDKERDSGWRVFAGDETQEYADEPTNFAMYNAGTIVEMDPTVASVLATAWPATFFRDASGRLVPGKG